MAPKVICWRQIYDPSGHDLLRDAGAEVLVVDTADAQEVAAALKDAQALWASAANAELPLMTQAV